MVKNTTNTQYSYNRKHAEVQLISSLRFDYSKAKPGKMRLFCAVFSAIITYNGTNARTDQNTE